MLLEGLSDQSICMGEVDLLLVKVQESVTSAVNNTTNASRMMASIALGLYMLVTPGTGGPLDEVVAHVGASAASKNTLKDEIAKLLGFFMALEKNYNMKLALLSHSGGGHFPSTLPIRPAASHVTT